MLVDLVQIAALLAILVGVAMLLPVGWVLVADGALVLAAALAVERKVSG